MRIGVVSIFPGMFDALRVDGVVGRAITRGILDLQCWNPRDYTVDKHRRVDDRPYGGGPGMVMGVEPLRESIRAARAATTPGCRVVYLSPQGRRLDQSALQNFAQAAGLILVAGRYEGVDERLIQGEVDEEWSIGDYVLSGGELAAMVVIDGVTRLLPGVLGHSESALQDSYSVGLLDCPHYTRPEEIDGRGVPPVLLGGDHQAIARWRMQQSLGRTWLRRPDLLEKLELSSVQRRLLMEFIEAQKGGE